jgi:hypothetical protein
MSDEIAAAGREVVEMLGACGAAPDDVEIGQTADEALMRLEQLLAVGQTETTTAGSSLSQKGSSS